MLLGMALLACLLVRRILAGVPASIANLTGRNEFSTPAVRNFHQFAAYPIQTDTPGHSPDGRRR